MNAQLVRSPRAAPAGTGSADLSAGSDSPVSTLSSHCRPVVSSSRRSAGTTSPSATRTTSPGTSSVTSTCAGCPSRTTTAVCRTWECSASVARSARYSLTKPRPTLASRIVADDHGVGALAEEEGDQRRDREQHQHGAAELPAEDAPRLGAVGAHRVRADGGPPPRHLLRRQTVRAAAPARPGPPAPAAPLRRSPASRPGEGPIGRGRSSPAVTVRSPDRARSTPAAISRSSRARTTRVRTAAPAAVMSASSAPRARRASRRCAPRRAATPR